MVTSGTSSKSFDYVSGTPRALFPRMDATTLRGVSNEELIAEALGACANIDRENVRVLYSLIEIEDRRLHALDACSSMFEYCTTRLRMSEGAAFLRIGCARLLRRFPMLANEIATGQLHMSTLIRLREHLTEDNVDEMIEAVRGKTRQQVLELLAMRASPTDRSAKLRKLPTLKTKNAVEAALERDIEAIAEMRYRLGLTMSREERDELLYVRDLMMHCNPSGDLNKVFIRAVRALRRELERELMRQSRPSKKPVAAAASAEPVEVKGATMPLANTAKIPERTRRFVFKRDGHRCTFESASGKRCSATNDLECDHIILRVHGGTNDPGNLRTRCRLHNHLHAEQVLGADFMREKIRSSQLKSAARKAGKSRVQRN